MPDSSFRSTAAARFIFAGADDDTDEIERRFLLILSESYCPDFSR